jgi:HK97 gp10 family phage protein
MITVNITPTFQKLGNAYKKASNNLNNTLMDIIGEFSFTIERYAKQVTPVDTGRLRSSIWAEKYSGRSYRVGTHNVSYARYVHEGTWKMRSRPFMEHGLNFAIQSYSDATFSSKLDKELRRSLSII